MRAASRRLSGAAYEARAGMPLQWLRTFYGCDEGAILAAAGLTFEAQRHRQVVRGEIAFASVEPLPLADLDAAVLAHFERGR